MRKARVTIRRVRRKTDYDIGVTGARVGHVYFRYMDIHALRIRRGRFFGPKIAILSTEVIDYRIHADAQSVEEYLMHCSLRGLVIERGCGQPNLYRVGRSAYLRLLRSLYRG
jgi:hypothetical protein